MKNLIILSLAILPNMLFAQMSEEFMTAAEQKAYVDKEAKEIRRQYYIAGHQYVNSSQHYQKKSDLDYYVKRETQSRYEEALDSEQISDLYRCYYSKTCEVYLVSLSSDFHGGYGQESHFILLNTKKGNHQEISHTVYSE